MSQRSNVGNVSYLWPKKKKKQDDFALGVLGFKLQTHTIEKKKNDIYISKKGRPGNSN